MSRGERLSRFMKDRDFTARDLSRASGVPYTTIRSMIERDLNNASIDNTLKICKALNISVEDILENNSSEHAIIVETETTYNYIPHPISAGLPSPVEATQQLPSLSIPDSIMGKYAGQQDIHMMRVNGESMNRIIPHGTLIAVKKTAVENIKDGDIVVYRDDYEYAVKSMYRNGDKLIFKPDSNDFRFTDYETSVDEKLDIVGKVVVYIVELD